MESTLPYIDPNQKINPKLLSMAGPIPMPSQEEIDSDPRLKEAFCSAMSKQDLVEVVRKGEEDIRNGNFEIVNIDKL